MKKLCCPQCGGSELTAVTDRDIAGAIGSGIIAAGAAGALGGIASAASNLNQRTFWLCKNCGHKFRNPEELRSEAKMYQKRFTGLMIFAGVIALLSFILAFALFSKSAVLGILFLLLGLILVLLPLTVRAKASSRQKELAQIENGMKQFLE